MTERSRFVEFAKKILVYRERSTNIKRVNFFAADLRIIAQRIQYVQILYLAVSTDSHYHSLIVFTLSILIVLNMFCFYQPFVLLL